MLDVPVLMTKLAERRPVFHSEADFQHELACQIHTEHPAAHIRLERPIQGLKEGKGRLDIWVRIDGLVDAIELKYQTQKLTVEVDGESFDLADKGAEDVLSYDFLSDLARVEKVVGGNANHTGHVVLLSNEALWEPGKNAGQFNKDAFRVHHERKLAGSLEWRKVAESDRQAAPIVLQGKYDVEWRDYSPLGFRYLWLSTSSIQ